MDLMKFRFPRVIVLPRVLQKGARAATQCCEKCVHHKESEFAEEEAAAAETPKEDRFHSSKEDRSILLTAEADHFSHVSKKIQAARKRARKAAEMFQSEYPFFKTVLRRHNIYNSFVYVPAGFALKYLPSESIKLQNSDGKQWPARCFYREGSGAGRSIGKGWATFSKENDLEEGDVVVFELIDRNTLVLEVSIFRMVEFLDDVN
uniref:TF-B3 domain-containing protein n=1 Tax=Fagus sylvatica TaxID=28930 RepID=A0A2N9EQV8_FAGSY